MKGIIVGVVPAMMGTLFNGELNDILHLQRLKLFFEKRSAEWRHKVRKTSIIKELTQNITRVTRAARGLRGCNDRVSLEIKSDT